MWRSYSKLRAGSGQVQAAVPRLLYGISVFGVPGLIALMSLFALFAWDGEYVLGSHPLIEFRILRESSPLSPTAAAQKLSAFGSVDQFDTQRAPEPFWFDFAVPLQDPAETTIELRSRHEVEATCWNEASLSELGHASRREATGALSPAKAGFALNLGSMTQPVRVLCRGVFEGPAHVSLMRWTTPGFAASVEKFHRDSGLLDGGLGVLAAFVLLTALINRRWLYVIFAAWLAANLRMAALSAGWDTQWFEHVIPWDWMIPIRKATAVLYYILTVTLFCKLFQEDLKKVGFGRLMRANQWSCVVLALAAAVLPFRNYLPVLWTATIFNVVVISFMLLRILTITHSRVAMWYAASLALTLSATLYEVIAAALGVRGLLGSVNSVTAAVSSSVIVALAIAEHMRQEHLARVEAQEQLHHAYEAIPIGLFTLDQDGHFTRTNPAFVSMMGARQGALAHWADYFGASGWSRLQAHVTTGGGQGIELTGILIAGGPRHSYLVGATMANGKIEGSLQDITERVAAAEQLTFLADHDPLTGILNRRGIEKVLSHAVEASLAGGAVALGYLDLDRFKLINDLFGHSSGDEVLKQVCARITAMLGEGQQMGRVGGDEFVIVFECESIESASRVCRTIVEVIGTAPYQLSHRAFQIKGSIGLVEIGPEMSVPDAIPLADRACREAKKGQTEGLVVYPANAPEVRERNDELRLVQRFGSSTVPDGLFLLMQPIMSLSEPYGSLDFEVLLRLREADQSITPAGKIIGAAEANGRIALIDRWVLSQTLEWLATNEDALASTRFVCVNLSGGSLNDERFVQDVYAMLANAGRTAQRLCIEITESVALHDLEYTRRFLERTRSYGTRIALDDFGAGYTSFSYLRELPADAVKIDGTFVKGVLSHPANLAIVAAIVELARNLGMKSIAEWVEDSATLKALSEVGVDYIQGYAVSMPQLPSKILAANSAASFIRDPAVAQFVRDSYARTQTEQLWSHVAGRPTERLH